jgi:hypothetical protein
MAREYARRAGREWDHSWKFERTNPCRSLAFIRIRRDSHRQSSQDLCGGSHLRQEFESMSHLTVAL